MRWLYHLLPASSAQSAVTEASGGGALRGPYAPDSLAREGFVHCSYRDAVNETARLYFAPDAALDVLQVDPRRLDAPLVEAETPRGPMPHVHGAIPADAIRARTPLPAFDDRALPDRVTGTRFAFVGFAGMTLLDLVGPLDALSRIASMGFDLDASFEVVAATERPIFAAHAARLDVARVRPPLDEFDVVIVAGGAATRALRSDRAVVEWLRAYPANRLIASVCSGALLLGAAGRLAGRRATTHASVLPLLAEYGAEAMTDRVVDAGQVVTAGGVTAGIDLGLHLVGRLAGGEAPRGSGADGVAIGAVSGLMRAAVA